MTTTLKRLLALRRGEGGGKKGKNVSFYRDVCMCKGKTNTC